MINKFQIFVIHQIINLYAVLFLDINDVKFYAPISHNIQKFQTSMIIYDGVKPISSIRFSFMLPATTDVLTVKQFKKIAQTDKHYADLLIAEYNFLFQT